MVFMVVSWAASRSGRAFVLAIPAMGVLFGCLGAYWVVGQYGYKHAKENSSAGRNYHMQFSPDNPEYAEGYAWKNFGLIYDEEKPEENLHTKFALAKTLYGNDKEDEAVRLMQNLAPDDEVGFAEAHIWQADYYRFPEISGMDEKAGHAKSKAHLQRAIEASPENLIARNGLANELVRESRWAEDTEEEIKLLKEGLKYYGQVAFQYEFQSPVQLSAVATYLDLLEELAEKDPANADKYNLESKRRAQSAITKYRLIAFRIPNYFPLWLTLVRCAVHLKDFDQADELITSSHQLASDKGTRDNIARLSAQILVEKADAVEDISTEEGYREKLFALCESITTDFRLEESYKRIVELLDNPDASGEQEIWIRSAISSSNKVHIPGVVHVIVGLQDITDENYGEGEEHWKTANQQFQFAQYAINNIVRVFAQEKEIGYEKRLEYMTVATELFPQQPIFRMTRGNFHKEAGQYESAIKDLENARKSMAIDLLPLVESLVECYEKTGNAEKQDELQKIVDEMKLKAEQAQRAAQNLPPLKTEEDKEDEGNEDEA